MAREKKIFKKVSKKWLSIFAVIGITLIILWMYFGKSASNQTATPAQESSPNDQKETGNNKNITQKEPPAKDLIFAPDAGLRVGFGSFPNIKFVDGKYQLLYEKELAAWYLADSEDGISFSNERKITEEEALYFRAFKLPDGTYRTYFLTKDGISSSFSDDDAVFTRETGVRYTPHKLDNGSIGAFDLFNDKNGKTILLYTGDLGGKNNIRMAVSTDNGKNFIFDNDNVFGDSDALTAIDHYASPKAITLSDGRIRVFAAEKGLIYSFVSSDGKYFSMETEIRLSPDDFSDLQVASLYDPQIVQLPDGHYRLYASAEIGLNSGRTAIVSATTR